MSSQPFISRLGLIENLQKHLCSGKSAVMIGGPMIGKTTLAHHLAERIQDEKYRALLLSLKEMNAASDFWSLLMTAILHQGKIPAQKNPYRKSPESFTVFMSQLHHIYEKTPDEVKARKLILLIDDCDRFLPDHGALIGQIVNMVMELILPPVDAVCWIGGPLWADWVDQHKSEFVLPVRVYPLSTVPVREARAIIQGELGASAVEQVWRETGGHPFLMEKAFGHGSQKNIDDLNRRLVQVLRPEEIAILGQLEAEGEWMILDSLKGEDGQRPPKKLLDRLCMLGVVVRTLNNGTAVIRKTSGQRFKPYHKMPYYEDPAGSPF